MTLARPFRLSGATTLRQLFEKGRTVRASSFLLRYLPNQYGRNRLAVMVPRSVSPKAVVRNRWRRIISEQLKDFFQNGAGWDVAVVASPTILKKPLAESKSELQQAIRKIIVKP